MKNPLQLDWKFGVIKGKLVLIKIIIQLNLYKRTKIYLPSTKSSVK